MLSTSIKSSAAVAEIADRTADPHLNYTEVMQQVQ